jgi:hypothetical protein
MMNTTTQTVTGAMHFSPWVSPSWSVVGYREAVYQACQGAGAWVNPSNGQERRVRVGERVRLTGTVKVHGEYQGKPQTYLARCKAVAS